MDICGYLAVIKWKSNTCKPPYLYYREFVFRMQENLPLHSFHKKKIPNFLICSKKQNHLITKDSSHSNQYNMHLLTVHRQCCPWSRYKTSILSYISSILPFCCVPYEWSSQSKYSCSCNQVLNIWLSSFYVFILRYLKWKLWHTFFFFLFPIFF